MKTIELTLVTKPIPMQMEPHTKIIAGINREGPGQPVASACDGLYGEAKTKNLRKYLSSNPEAASKIT